jgi:hypothetical protein
LRVLRTPHAGIVATLNRGLAEARGDLIARMDADDIALPGRLSAQLRFMESHPDVVLLGTRFVYVDSRSRPLFNPGWPCDDADIRRALPVYNCFTHPTVMFRKSAALRAGGYRQELEYQEDYDLWLRMLDVGQAAQLPDVLLYYRLSSASVSFRNRRQQSTILDALVKALHEQRRLQGQDVLQRGQSIAPLRDGITARLGRWAQRHRWGRQLQGWARGCLEAGRRWQAFRFAMEAVWADPAARPNWGLLARSLAPGWAHDLAVWLRGTEDGRRRAAG